MTLLWYVHHHGTGHWRRALAVGARLGQPIVFLSSRQPPWPLPEDGRFVPLPPDTPGEAVGADAGGRLHWAPLGAAGLLARNRMILEAAGGATRAVVDVSVEVAVLLRVSGIRVTLVQLPGDRSDPPHQLARDLADDVVQPVPADWELETPGVTAIGLVSMLSAPREPLNPGGPVVVVVVAGAGGGGLTDQSLLALQGAHDIVVADGTREIGPLLRRASVVVGGAGLGTVSDVAATGRPFVLLPAGRPFGEQAATAAACAAHENVVVLARQPTSSAAWTEAVDKARAAGEFAPDVNGADRFATLLQAS